MAKEELILKLTREEIEILLYALFQSMKARQNDMREAHESRADNFHREIRRLEEVHHKLAAAYDQT